MAKHKFESLREKGLQKHFQALGIDYALFGEMVASKASVSAIKRSIEKQTGHDYTWSTVSTWVKLYKEQA